MAHKTVDPGTLSAFSGAAAGHDGVLSDPSGALVIKPCTPAEVNFYETSIAEHPKFAAFMPTYMGTLTLGAPDATKLETSTSAATTKVEDGTAATLAPDDVGPMKGKKLNTELSIVLENVAHGFKKPNIMDLKLGSRLWDDNAKPEKRARLDKVSQETTSGSLGFRIAGMRVWHGAAQESDGFRNYDKLYGRQFDKETVIEGFRKFFFVPEAGIDQRRALRVVQRVRVEIEGIQEVLYNQESRMIGASVLIVYEGDPEAFDIALEKEEILKQKMAKKAPDAREDEDGHSDDNVDPDVEGDELEELEDEEVEGVKIHAVKLIDFAHAAWVPGEGPDTNALQGVESTLELLSKVIREL